MARPLETIRGRDESFNAIGQSRVGRYLRIIYSHAHDGDGIFVVTAYELSGRQLRALKHRLKRRHR